MKYATVTNPNGVPVLSGTKNNVGMTPDIADDCSTSTGGRGASQPCAQLFLDIRAIRLTGAVMHGDHSECFYKREQIAPIHLPPFTSAIRNRVQL
jgi:hypothetical protein